MLLVTYEGDFFQDSLSLVPADRLDRLALLISLLLYLRAKQKLYKTPRDTCSYGSLGKYSHSQTLLTGAFQ